MKCALCMLVNDLKPCSTLNAAESCRKQVKPDFTSIHTPMKFILVCQSSATGTIPSIHILGMSDDTLAFLASLARAAVS